MSDIASPLPEQLLNKRYRVVGELGAGGMAIVYRGIDERTGRQVAIKIMREELGPAFGGRRFKREIEVAAGLNHPNVLPVYDSGEHDGQPYYVMPLVEGESLRDRLNRERQLGLEEAVVIARDVADGLSHAHSLGLVHRDIKPENILLSGGHAVVADFGVARAFDAQGVTRITETGVAVGTPTYMSPEQAAGEANIDGRVDIYALGCVLYEMLTGSPPFSGGTVQALLARHMTEPVPSISGVRPTVPRALEASVMRALAKVPADRYASARQFAESLVLQEADPVPTSGPTTVVPNLGALVSRMCDRWAQVNAVDAFIRIQRASSSGRPMMIVVPGTRGSGHTSLVDRLVHTRIRPFIEELNGREAGALVRLSCPWPTHRDFEIQKRDLAIALFREADPTYFEPELSIERFAALQRLAASPAVVVEHEVRSSNWDDRDAALLRWYVREFWTGAPRPGPQFIVFVKLVLEGRRLGGVLPEPRTLTGRRFRTVLTQAKHAVLGADAPCPGLVLDELSLVTVDDVMDWFRQHNVYESEHRQQEAASALFAGKREQPMTFIEEALGRIHREFTDEFAAQRGMAL